MSTLYHKPSGKRFSLTHNAILYCANTSGICYNAAMEKQCNRKLKMLAHLDMRHAASRETIGGILRFAAIHQSWEVQVAGAHPSNESLEHFSDWRPDALVIDGSCHNLDKGELSSISGRAAVFVNTAAPTGWRKPCATLTTDERGLAKDAADLFRRKGLVHFAFVGSPAAERWREICHAVV